MRTRGARGGPGPIRVLAICGAFLTAWGAGCAEPPQPSAPPAARNALLIVIDTLRADRLGAWGYVRPTSPSIDALAAEGVRFDRAYATAPWTMPSVASMFTGRHAAAHGVTRLGVELPDDAVTLADVLAAQGFATSAVVSHHLIGRRYGFHQGFGAFDQTESKTHDHVSTGGVTERAIAQLEELASGEVPFFLFVHYFDPHYTYMQHASIGWSRVAGRLEGGESMRVVRKLPAPLRDEEVAFLRDAYDEEVRHTDAGIGELLAALGALGLADTTVVALTADHGEELYERGWVGHTRHLYEELIRVPLIVRAPGGQAGRVVEAPVSLVSLAPTLLDALGEPPDRLVAQAPSLMPLVRGEAARPPSDEVYVDVAYDPKPPPGGFVDRRSANMRALVGPRWKLIHDRHTDGYELYDLEADPSERDDLARAEPERVASMRARLDRRTAEAAGSAVGEQRAGGAPAELDEEERARLESLGYLDR